MNSNKGSVVKQSVNDVEGCRPQKVLFQPNVCVILQYNVKSFSVHNDNALELAPSQTFEDHSTLFTESSCIRSLLFTTLKFKENRDYQMDLRWITSDKVL